MPTLATPDATRTFFRRHPQVHPLNIRDLTGLSVSSIGIGTYLGESDAACDARYLDAIVRAVESGVNLVDTAINYRCQRSERTVGAALRRLMESGKVRREEIAVCTKGGYVPFDGEAPRSREQLTQYLERVFFAPGVVRPEEILDGQHCLSPSYLRHQFAASLGNLGLDAIDVYYLHNPETQLNHVRPENFMERIRAAFVELEGKVRKGELRCYGLATWSGFRVPPDRRNHLSLEALVNLAEECAGENHRFRVVQLPCSLAMNEAWTVPTQDLDGERVTFVEAAARLGIRTVFSGTMSQGKLAYGLPPRLTDILGGESDPQRALRFAASVPGVSCALSGMSRTAHVGENLKVLEQPPAEVGPLKGTI